MVSEFDRTNSYYGGGAYVEPSTGDASHQLKLPGARSLLEHAHIPQDEGRDSQVYPGTFERPYSTTIPVDYSHAPSTGLDAADRDWKSDACPPGMPILLAKARGLPLERPSEDPQAIASARVSTGPASPARGSYHMVSSGRGSGLPIMTIGQTPATHTSPQPQGTYQQGAISQQTR